MRVTALAYVTISSARQSFGARKVRKFDRQKLR
jgi:hypothetical protein